MEQYRFGTASIRGGAGGVQGWYHQSASLSTGSPYTQNVKGSCNSALHVVSTITCYICQIPTQRFRKSGITDKASFWTHHRPLIASWTYVNQLTTRYDDRHVSLPVQERWKTCKSSGSRTGIAVTVNAMEAGVWRWRKASRPGRFTSGKEQWYPLNRRFGGLQCPSDIVKKRGKNLLLLSTSECPDPAHKCFRNYNSMCMRICDLIEEASK
jgi:hypothetical protein